MREVRGIGLAFLKMRAMPGGAEEKHEISVRIPAEGHAVDNSTVITRL